MTQLRDSHFKMRDRQFKCSELPCRSYLKIRVNTKRQYNKESNISIKDTCLLPNTLSASNESGTTLLIIKAIILLDVPRMPIANKIWAAKTKIVSPTKAKKNSGFTDWL